MFLCVSDVRFVWVCMLFAWFTMIILWFGYGFVYGLLMVVYSVCMCVYVCYIVRVRLCTTLCNDLMCFICVLFDCLWCFYDLLCCVERFVYGVRMACALRLYCFMVVVWIVVRCCVWLCTIFVRFVFACVSLVFLWLYITIIWYSMTSARCVHGCVNGLFVCCVYGLCMVSVWSLYLLLFLTLSDRVRCSYVFPLFVWCCIMLLWFIMFALCLCIVVCMYVICCFVCVYGLCITVVWSLHACVWLCTFCCYYVCLVCLHDIVLSSHEC